MVNTTHHFASKAIASLGGSEDQNDQAFCASLSFLLMLWHNGESQVLLDKLRAAANRERLVNMPEFSLN